MVIAVCLYPFVADMMGFDDALTKAYLSMAKDTAMIRKKRAAKKKKMKK